MRIHSPALPVHLHNCPFNFSCPPKNVASLPSPVAQLFKYVASLGFDALPDYERCRGFFAAEMRQTGGKIDLQAAATKKKTTAKKSPVKKVSTSPLKSVVVATKKKRTPSLSPVKKKRGGVNGSTPVGKRKVVVEDSMRYWYLKI